MRRTLPVFAAVAMSLIPVADAMAAGYASRTLAVGDSGSDVRALQRYLDRTGYETDVDGEFGRGTRASVMSFERAETGRANGRASRGEQRLLRKRAAGTDSTETDASGEGGAGYEEGAPVTEAPGEEAYIGDDGLAVAPASAPQEVKDIIAAATRSPASRTSTAAATGAGATPAMTAPDRSATCSTPRACSTPRSPPVASRAGASAAAASGSQFAPTPGTPT